MQPDVDVSLSSSKSAPGSTHFNIWKGRVLEAVNFAGASAASCGLIATFVLACQLVHLGNIQSLQSCCLAKRMSIAYGVVAGGVCLSIPKILGENNEKKADRLGTTLVSVAMVSLFLALSILASRRVISPYKLGLSVVITYSVASGLFLLGAGLGGAICLAKGFVHFSHAPSSRKLLEKSPGEV